jgi:gamma-glutamylcyclotransferase (GGCT)/AIG2-like uncharacterized protein YtfP
MTELESCEHRLAVYGTLAPGRSNHHQVSDLGGEWIPGTVRGRLVSEGWGVQMGYPGLVLDPVGAEIAVQVLESSDLPAHWGRLDEFEGADYRRVAVSVATANGELGAYIYVVAPQLTEARFEVELEKSSGIWSGGDGLDFQKKQREDW